jgi:hypothetical protein
MGNFLSRRKVKYNGVDTRQLLEHDDIPVSFEDIKNILNETKSELGNTNNMIKYIEEQTSQNIQLISNDLHHIHEEFNEIKSENTVLKAKLEEIIKINRILGKKINNINKTEIDHSFIINNENETLIDFN